MINAPIGPDEAAAPKPLLNNKGKKVVGALVDAFSKKKSPNAE